MADLSQLTDRTGARVDELHIMAPFHAYYLKGKGKLDLPEALTFRTGVNEWVRHDAWPAKADLAERCAALRNQQPPVDNMPKEPTTELFSIEKSQASRDNHVPVSLETFWSVGKKHGYPEIPDLDLKGGMSGWNSFSLAHRLQIPDVVARLGCVD